MNDPIAVPPDVLRDIRRLIEAARQRVAVSVNAELSMLHWHIGRRLHREVLGARRADYGQQIVSTVSRQLVEAYGRGFSAKNLHHMLRFAEVFPDEGIVSPLARQLSWSHFKEFLYIGDPLKREFYVEMARLEGWSVRQLRERMQSMLFERTAISKKPEEALRQELQQLAAKQEPSADMLLKDLICSTFSA